MNKRRPTFSFMHLVCAPSIMCALFLLGCSSLNGEKLADWSALPEVAPLAIDDSFVRPFPQHHLEGVVHAMIASAEREILLAHFIVVDDDSGARVLESLEQRSREGVDVRIIVDGIGAYTDFDLTNDRIDELARAGIKVQVYHPKGRRIMRLKKRMHDKILIADDHALLGSSSFWNLSFSSYQTEYDMVVRGGVIDDIRMHFAELWSSDQVFAKAIDIVGPFQLEVRSEPAPLRLDMYGCEVLAENLVYSRDPSRKTKDIGSLKDMVGHLQAAESSVVIVNPYFMPVGELRHVLSEISARGVSVRVYTNSPEVLARQYKMVGVSYDGYASYFKEAGLKIYETLPDFGMVHDKLVIIDDQTLYVGSFNYDPLSVKHNTENGVFFESPFVKDNMNERIRILTANSSLAFDDGKQGRESYSIGNPLEALWIRFCLLFLSDVM